MQRVREFDGVRGVLSIIVVTGHINGALVPWFWGCMEVFFCLSGFLIGSIVLEQHDQPKFLKNYFARRALRIWPTYFCALFFVLLFSFALEHGTGMQWSCGSGCIRSFWFLQNVELLATPGIPFSLPRVGYPPFFDHSWSLAIEEQFYLFALFFAVRLLQYCPNLRCHSLL